MPENFEGLTYKQLEVKARFYLNSAIRAETELERLQTAVKKDEAILRSHAKHRRQLRAKHQKAREEFKKVKALNHMLGMELEEAHKFVLDMVEKATVHAETIEAALTATGVWEASPKE